MTPTLPPPALLPRTLSTAQFQTLAEVPPEIEWFANLTNANTRRVYEQDIEASWPLQACASRSSSVR
jgi:hypothetical protein